MEKQIGKTKDAGFQFGIRKTIPISAEKAWDFLISNKGLNVWLGSLSNELEIDKEFVTENGITGSVRVFNVSSHIRLNWKPKNWQNTSTLQIRVIGDNKKATIAIHQEKLLDFEQRTEMKEYWSLIINKLTEEMINSSS